MKKLFFAIFIVAAMIANPDAGVQASANGSRGCDCSSCHNYADQCVTNSPPRANAGVDQTVRSGAVVTLDGSNSSDPNGSIASYAWRVAAGPAVALSNPVAVKPTFTAPSAGASGASITFELTVKDAAGLTAKDTCIVNVTPGNVPPVANAGPDQSGVAGATVTLNGSNSTDSDGTVASYAWKQTAGTTVTLSNASTAKPTFTAPSAGNSGTSLTFQLTVTDNGGLTATDTCIVNVARGNIAPVANAGPDQSGVAGATVTLNGSNSTDSDGTIVSYAWKQATGTAVTLSNAAVANPTFTAPSAGTSGTSLTFQLTVTDNGGLTATDTCIVNLARGNIEPVANAGPDQSAATGATISLNGSNSTDSDGTIASYAWKQTAGPAVTLSNASAAAATFTAPAAAAGGTSLTFQLTVKDNGGLTATDACIVNITAATPANKPPVANAGLDQAVDSGDMVTLDGRNSTDPDNRIVSYLWRQTAGPAVTLLDATNATTIFEAPDGGDSGTSLTFQLAVTDAGGLQASDTCIINISPSGGSTVNQPPVADAGPDQKARRDERVTLDGSNSSDSDDGIVSYRWKQISGFPVTLSNSDAEAPTFRVPADKRSGKSLTFRLTVTDEGGLKSSDTCVVQIGKKSSSNDEHDDDKSLSNEEHDDDKN
jgi:hypothetical protein